MTKKLTKNSSSTLDLIRAVSSQLVVVGHGISFCGVAVSLHQPNFPWMQNIAVVIFFILSGFLISYSLEGKKDNINYNFTHYAIDRFSRIYVAFIPALIFTLIIDNISIQINQDLYRHIDAFNIKTFIGNILMLQDYPKINFVTSFGSSRPFWTLAIEWWIYLFFGSIFFSIQKKISIKKNAALIIFFSIIPIYNLFGGRGNGLTLYWLYGVTIFYIWKKDIFKKISSQNIYIYLAITMLIASYTVMSTKREYDPLFALYLAVIVLLCIEISSRTRSRKMAASCAKFFAGYSYTLYLIHYSIFDILVTHYGGGYTIFFIGFIASNIFAYIIGYFFEIILTKKIKTVAYKFIKNRDINLMSSSQ